MYGDPGKYWATHRGWISNNFSVKNSPSHFLNAYKKKHHHSKTTANNHLDQAETHHEVVNQNDDYLKSNHKKLASSFKQTQSRILQQQSLKKPKTAPLNNWSFMQPDSFEKQSSRNPIAIKPKRNKSLQYKRSKRTEESPIEMRQLSEIQKLQIQSDRHRSASQKNFKSTNYGRYKPQLMFLKPQMRNSNVRVNLSKVKTYEILEQKKSSIYKQISKSMYVDEKIDSFDRQNNKSASIRHYQPIEYMTQYGEASEQKHHHCQQQQEPQSKRQQQQRPHPRSFRRKHNIEVLKNKLNSQFKQSIYRQKLSNITIQPQICFISH